MIQREPLNLSEADLERLRASGDAFVVRIGEAEVVVQDAAAYRRMLSAIEEMDDARSAEICRRRLDDLAAGRSEPLTVGDFIKRIRKQVGLDR